MRVINFIEKETNYIDFTFTKDEIRLKTSPSYLKKNKERLTELINIIEPFVYRNFKYTLKYKLSQRSLEGSSDMISLHLRVKNRRHKKIKAGRIVRFNKLEKKVIQVEKFNNISREVIYNG